MFELLKTDGTTVTTAITNSDGIAIFNNLYQGNYKLKEVAAGDNYVSTSETFDVNVTYNTTTTKTITNKYKSGNLLIKKVDKENNEIPLENVVFELYSYKLDRVIGTYKTDMDGKIEINNLQIGQYRLIEKDSGQWYNLVPITEISIKWNETTKVTIENETKKGEVKIIKLDKENNEIKLEGVEFEILDENDKILEKVVTDKNGEAVTSKYALRDFPKLKIREIKTADGYILSEEVRSVNLIANAIVRVVFENEHIKEEPKKPETPEEPEKPKEPEQPKKDEKPEEPNVKVEEPPKKTVPNVKKLPKTGF